MRTPRGCANATVDLETVPDDLPNADADAGLRTVDHTHSRSLTVFEPLRALAKSIGLSESRSGI
jgi:hypothetical protein